ncbi:RibD family protein [Zavarzinia compransoris]|uniref:Riboflavin deaminase n=1 Tax=Zavarzinia compransoris TaxID=1264899 RepID=A0A317E916_9PROT|nr:RibD family protein [Zavarzinia compransoris]PWR23072.1 riboflavin deaminase [Zavarzinia compransoris]TDP46380.1 riboflavin biosynthesis pyrimidine reductase [Zavarzinia compransoris]
MKPLVICHMVTSLDGRLHPGRWTDSPDGGRADWSALYEEIHRSLAGDAWIVGRVTMAEMSGGAPHAPTGPVAVSRPWHFADRAAGAYAIAMDPAGRLHFQSDRIGGDHIVVVLGPGVGDSHLAALAADGISYLVAEDERPDPAKVLAVLGRELGIRRLLLEGGAVINGAFFAAGLVDELSLLVAPALDGRTGAAGVIDAGEAGLAGRAALSLTSCAAVGFGAVHLRYAVHFPPQELPAP